MIAGPFCQTEKLKTKLVMNVEEKLGGNEHKSANNSPVNPTVNAEITDEK